MLNPVFKIDSSGLNKAIVMGNQFSKRTPAQAVNSAAYAVAIVARNNMPSVSADKISSELSVIETPVIGKRGKNLKNKKTLSGGAFSAKTSDVPLTVLIIQASARPGSKYNRTTDSRYALSGSPFKGVSREAGREAMRAMEQKMIATRRKSGSFIKAGFSAIVKLMKGSVTGKFMANSFAQFLAGEEAAAKGFGDAKPASEGSANVSATISNLIGEEQNRFDKPLQTIGGPVLQSALNTEGVKQLEYFCEKSVQYDLVAPFNKLTS